MNAHLIDPQAMLRLRALCKLDHARVAHLCGLTEAQVRELEAAEHGQFETPELKVQAALKIAVTLLPMAMPRSVLLWLVMMAAIVPPRGKSSTTSVLTAPVCTRVTSPANWLRAEKRAPALSATRMIDDALISANASAPGTRPRLALLPCVTMATMC